MPFLRILRDKRGYETSYLMHWFREGTRQRSKVLYVFRTPGGVRVGRDPFDRDVLLEIEARYPEIDFDWDAVRQNQQVIEAVPERRRRPRREAGDEPAQPAAAAAPPAAPPPSPASVQPRPASVPTALEGATPDEQIAFLSAWHPIIRERIAARTWEAERRDALLALADRLNPAAWTDADEITAGLQQAGEALERLSRVLGRRRRRARKRGRPESAAVSGQPTPDHAAASDAAEPDDGEDDDAP